MCDIPAFDPLIINEENPEKRNLLWINRAIENIIPNPDSLATITEIYRETWIDIQTIKNAIDKGLLNTRHDGKKRYIIKDENYLEFVKGIARIRTRRIEIDGNRDAGLNPYTGLPPQKRGRKSNEIKGTIFHAGTVHTNTMGVRGLPDIDLIIKWQSNSELAFNEIMRRYSSELINYMHALTKDMNDANDIVQDVFIKIHNRERLLLKELPLKEQLNRFCKESKTELNKDGYKYKTTTFSDIEARLGFDPNDTIFGDTTIKEIE